ncbi:hypothetical protein F4861DRAFT_495611 [Xylaria intraflava]|nr:hypothetical protein F4861DRAFT_495611 [Xylaria intraflava]
MKTASLTLGTSRPVKVRRRADERVILHFDYDCFYASVFENENPSLKSQALGVKQKSILATCNYVARARGVKKLMLISEAQRLCPDLVLLNGEDLTRFRDVSKKLWAFLRAHAWSGRVERLGLDEVFLDITDVVSYNQELLNTGALRSSFFQLDRGDPVQGFAFDGSRFHGCVRAAASSGEVVEVDVSDPLCVRLMLASHLAGYLRHKLDVDFGYTSSGGVATNKLLAKLAGSVNKPNNQTTLLSQTDGVVEAFMDAHKIRKIPGIGSRTAQSIEDHLLSNPTAKRDREGSITVGEVRQHPDMSAERLEQILDRPGAERGSGAKVWNLLHGIDESEVKEASDVPTQISIEDTYMSRPLQTQAEVSRELLALATSLIRRMRVDLTEADASPETPPKPRWLAHPRTIRLSTRTKPKTSEAQTFSRASRSAALPSFVFQLPHPATEDVAERLVTESLLPLFRRLHPERGGGWNLALLNICVANMAAVASGESRAPGRDIGHMFRAQGEALREWTVYDSLPASVAPGRDVDADAAWGHAGGDMRTGGEEGTSLVDEDAWEELGDVLGSPTCRVCGRAVPAFAMAAHERFHAMGE